MNAESFNVTELAKETKVIKRLLRKYDKYARPLVTREYFILLYYSVTEKRGSYQKMH